ncbi:hypothetical protein FNL56_13520 [Tardiphaga sp. vice304]|uniref:hypothetical protein n=1 Tax=Tardiphaga sp. vice304 TaxID=2592817 RepID=UPI00116540CA|nr:hypothetical protein [Tardiphaga sp. vice304]QDM27019.1 hypothetical protein FNL56_13520 [Tardiphaga sp. vice304]
MPTLLLRRNAVVTAYPDEFRVILPMSYGFELDVGGVSKRAGAHLRELWQWSSPGQTGRAASREDAMAELRAAWDASDEARDAGRSGQHPFRETFRCLLGVTVAITP